MVNEDLAGGERRDSARPSGVDVVKTPRADPYTGLVVDQRYIVESLLAEGGMGRVYRCRHRILDRKLAIKIIRSDVAQHPEAARRFLIEAKAASAIGNEHIIDIIDFGALPDGAAYLVMEFLDGVPLSSLVCPGQPLAPQRIAAITSQIAEGLSAAHAAGIVHRDLKPDNVILLERKGEDFVKILDFGVAQMAVAPDSKLTQAGSIVGTPCYMSPEQCTGAPLDHRSDIYSLGVMMYELAAGRLPFDGQHYLAVLHQHVQEPPPPFRSLIRPVEVPAELERIIFKCLAKRPEQRYATAAQLMRDIAPMAEGQSAALEALEASSSDAASSVEGTSPVGVSSPVPTSHLASPARASGEPLQPSTDFSTTDVATTKLAKSPVATAVLAATDSPATARVLELHERPKAPNPPQRLYLALLLLGALIAAWGLRGLSNAELSASPTLAAPQPPSVAAPSFSATASQAAASVAPIVRPIPSEEAAPESEPAALPAEAAPRTTQAAVTAPSTAQPTTTASRTAPKEQRASPRPVPPPSAPLATRPQTRREPKPSSATRTPAPAVKPRGGDFINPWPER